MGAKGCISQCTEVQDAAVNGASVACALPTSSHTPRRHDGHTVLQGNYWECVSSVTDEWVSSVSGIMLTGQQKHSDRHLSQCHFFFRYKPRMDWPEFEPWDVSDLSPGPRHGPKFVTVSELYTKLVITRSELNIWQRSPLSSKTPPALCWLWSKHKGKPESEVT